MRFASTVFFAATSLVGSLALPQGSTSSSSSSSSISFPGLALSPQAQTACINACSLQVANANLARTRACSSATGKSAAECLCTDSTLLADMQTCFGQKCAELQGRCAASIIDNGSSSTFSSGSTTIGGTGSTGTQGGSSSTTGGTSNGGATVSAATVSFPDVKLPVAEQSACINSCSLAVANANLARTRACAASGKSAAQCLCTDTALVAGMQTCYAQKCKELQGRCAAAIVDGGSSSSFIAGSSSTSGTTESSGTAGGSSGTVGGSGSPGGSSANGGSSAGRPAQSNNPAGGNAEKNDGEDGPDSGAASTRPVAISLVIGSGIIIASVLGF